MLMSASQLHPFAESGAADALTFLNEVASTYPAAVSFAEGRPYEGYFDLDEVASALKAYDEFRRADGWPADRVARNIFQYGPAKGVINDLISRHLLVDEGLEVGPESIVVTVGCQEALWLTLSTLCPRPDDVLLVVAPNFPGVWGCAAALGVTTEPVEMTNFDTGAVKRAAAAVRERGERPRALYLSSDGANPTGATVDLRQRELLLRAADELDILILEDNPYSLVAGSPGGEPSLKALDRSSRVVRLGTFSKSLNPGIRVGYALADQRVEVRGHEERLADTLARLKTVLTVNTSAVAQAVVGGSLVANDFSLRRARAREQVIYRRNRCLLLDGLQGLKSMPGYGWREPVSGFFMLLHTPFVTTDRLVERSASEFGVLWSPMHHFFPDDKPRHGLRLSFSHQEPATIAEGTRRLCAFLAAVGAQQ